MRVLVVDDDWLITRMLATLLESFGHSVIQSGDPLDAIERVEKSQLREDRIEAIISDWQMPGFDGIEVLTIIEQMCPRVRRILLTAAPGEPEVSAAVRSGLVQYLVEKPWTRADLQRALS